MADVQRALARKFRSQCLSAQPYRQLLAPTDVCTATTKLMAVRWRCQSPAQSPSLCSVPPELDSSLFVNGNLELDSPLHVHFVHCSARRLPAHPNSGLTFRN